MTGAGFRQVFALNAFSMRATHVADMHKRILPWPMDALYGLAWISARVQPIAPNRVPIPAVTAIANAPQKVTRSAPGATGAPPAYAAKPPSTARKAREVVETIGNRLASATMAAVSGNAAPTAKLAAEVNAA